MVRFSSLLSADLHFFLPSFQIHSFFLLPLLFTCNLIGKQIPCHRDISFPLSTRHQFINQPPFYSCLTLLLFGFDSTILHRIYLRRQNLSKVGGGLLGLHRGLDLGRVHTRHDLGLGLIHVHVHTIIIIRGIIRGHVRGLYYVRGLIRGRG
jgi:hypothetical protein